MIVAAELKNKFEIRKLINLYLYEYNVYPEKMASSRDVCGKILCLIEFVLANK